ncbi:MAG: hypothetical protein GMKNLPBB_01042 [Myxococcota bacterium]|nr:hypothetical protein [Myxococcota bacterium]
MSEQSSIIVNASLPEFFRSRLQAVLEEHSLDVREMTEYYLVQMLVDFLHPDRVFEMVDGGKQTPRTLAAMFADAANAAGDRKIAELRRLGDVALYTSGFFSERLRRGLVGEQYYVSMGRAAYAQCASLIAPRPSGFDWSETFHDLALRFETIVRVLRDLSSGNPLTDTDILRLYERWLATQSERAARLLRECGVQVNDSGRGMAN